MNDSTAIELAQAFLRGEVSLAQLRSALAATQFVALEGATLDTDRARRCGFPEVVYAPGKSEETLERVVAEMIARNIDVLVTRLSTAQAERLEKHFADGHYHPLARTYRRMAAQSKEAAGTGRVAVITAGSSDLPVAEEACETARWMRVGVMLVEDVGVAGPQRLVARLPEIVGADAVVVVAGMEGALPSVVGGHVDCPVIAVPTSVGYGANFGGLSALLTMLNSCAANVAVVNIDAGFKAGYLAGMIARRANFLKKDKSI